MTFNYLSVYKILDKTYKLKAFRFCFLLDTLSRYGYGLYYWAKKSLLIHESKEGE